MDWYSRFRGDFACGVIGIVLIQSASSFFDIGKDDSDSPTQRSGLIVKTDFLTGCQYLEGERGGLMPRVDAEGNQICDRELIK